MMNFIANVSEKIESIDLDKINGVIILIPCLTLNKLLTTLSTEIVDNLVILKSYQRKFLQKKLITTLNFLINLH